MTRTESGTGEWYDGTTLGEVRTDAPVERRVRVSGRTWNGKGWDEHYVVEHLLDCACIQCDPTYRGRNADDN